MLRGGTALDMRYLSGYDSAPGTSTTSGNSGSSNFSDFASQVKSGASSLTNTHPKNWTYEQILIVATGILSLWTLLLIISVCKKGWDKRRSKQRLLEDAHYMNMGFNDNKEALLNAENFEYKMERPVVTKNSTVRSYGSGYDANDPHKLPLGVRLHGAHKLRKDGLTGSGVRVAVIDSGIDHTHPGIHEKVQTKRWYRKGTPLMDDDHGTHVAGTIHFMAPDADLYDYRVFGDEGDLDGDAAIAKSIRTAVDTDKCHVINMSLRCSYPVRPEIEKAIKYAYKKGVHLVCAAGNDGDGNRFTDELFTYPARFDETISVAAVRKEEGLPATNFSESNSDVTYSGIGRDVISLKPYGGFQTMSGTSMATPHVTGLIACLLSNGKKYSDKQLRKLLKEQYTVDIGPKGYDKQTGEGFVTYVPKGGRIDEVFDLLALFE